MEAQIMPNAACGNPPLLRVKSASAQPGL